MFLITGKELIHMGLPLKSKSFRISEISDEKIKILAYMLTMEKGLDYNQTDIVVTAVNEMYDRQKEQNPVGIQQAIEHITQVGE